MITGVNLLNIGIILNRLVQVNRRIVIPVMDKVYTGKNDELLTGVFL
jgi:hypothetical protein